jgi:hypothetical protein
MADAKGTFIATELADHWAIEITSQHRDKKLSSYTDETGQNFVFSFPIRATCPAHPIHLNLSYLIISGEEYKIVKLLIV